MLLLHELPTIGTAVEQLACFQRVQELALRRDPTNTLLRAAAAFTPQLAQLRNASLAAALLQFLAQAARRSAVLLCELFEAVNALLLLSSTTERNALGALALALASLPQAFVFACDGAGADAAQDERRRALWAAAERSLELALEIVATAPLRPLAGADSSSNNRSALVWLRAWKLLEGAALLLSPAKDAAMYRDPARSNVQPDDVAVDRLALAPLPSHHPHPVLDRVQLEALGRRVTTSLCDRIGAMLQPLGRREVCVAINSVALLAALRPQLLAAVLPRLVAFHSENLPGSSDGVVQATLKANLVKLLSHPSAQPFADEVTECLISLGASERAFRALSKSKEPRRKYVSAPSEASLRKARIGKRSAQAIAEKMENDTAKRHRIGSGSGLASGSNAGAAGGAGAVTATATASGAASQQPITHETIVNMASSDVVNLVLESFAAALPTPPPPSLKLELTPSELKARMLALLAKVATPSSVLAVETSNKRMRDPRRRRDPRMALQEQPPLAPVFDAESVEEVSDWVSKNASSIAEPLISVAEDNTVHVFLKPATPQWCRDMAVAALGRILESERGVRIRGDDKLRELVLCRLASSPWLLLTDAKNAPVDPTRAVHTTLPGVYQTILDFVLDDYTVRAPLATALLYHEYTRFTGNLLASISNSSSSSCDGDGHGECEDPPASAADTIYRQAVAYFLTALVKKMDLSTAADKKLFGALVAQLPRVTSGVLATIGSLFDEKSGVVLGITVLRDLVRERAACQTPALRILLRYTCHEDESTRNSAIRCVANQLYSLAPAKSAVEQFAVRLVASLGEPAAASQPERSDSAPDDVEMGGDGAVGSRGTAEPEAVADTVPAARRQWLATRVRAMQRADDALERELLAFAARCEEATALSRPLTSEPETLRRLELCLALCAKKPALLQHVVAAYGRASDTVRQVVFVAIEKLIKHLKQRGTAGVVAQLHGFEAPSLGLVCHVLQLLSVRGGGGGGARPSDESAAADALVQQVLALYRAHEHVPDAVSVLIPVLPSVRAHVLFPLLPALLSLPPARLAVAITRLLEALPPQAVAPIDLLVALHRVDLKSEPAMQKKVISAVNLCVEHRHAFPADVLLHVCRVLVQDERVSKLALRTLILSVTAHPALRADAAPLLEVLAARRVWEMEDALWKGFAKCAALLQPASFPLLLQRLPAPQLRAVLDDEPELRALLRSYAASPEAAGLRVAPDVRELLAEQSEAAAAAAGGDEGDGDVAVKMENDDEDEPVQVKRDAAAEDAVKTEDAVDIKMEEEEKEETAPPFLPSMA
ncbi:hypothetical protein PybrP1_004706 [[Pythium] brassicae (nom. inval.)]|nr:hypothetical protein PybrP1_004706 [[Pythium] brassicae (nom. inval.)]